MAWTDLPGINDPVDGAFRADFIAALNARLPMAALNARLPAGSADGYISRAIQLTGWYGNLGSGSNAYWAANEALDYLQALTGIAADVPFDQGAADSARATAEARSPEGIARANDDDGFGGLAVLGAIAALGFAAFSGGATLGLLGGEAAGGALIGAEGIGVAELGLVADAATGAAAIEGGISAATLSGGAGALTLANSALPLIDISGIATPELGLIATPETAAAAIEAGIPVSMLSGGPGAITLEGLSQLPRVPTPSLSSSGASGVPGASSSFSLAPLEGVLAPLAGAVRSLLAGTAAPAARPAAVPAAQLAENNLLLLALAGAAAFLILKE